MSPESHGDPTIFRLYIINIRTRETDINRDIFPVPLVYKDRMVVVFIEAPAVVAMQVVRAHFQAKVPVLLPYNQRASGVVHIGT